MPPSAPLRQVAPFLPLPVHRESPLPLPPGEGRGEGASEYQVLSTSAPPHPRPLPEGEGGRASDGLSAGGKNDAPQPVDPSVRRLRVVASIGVTALFFLVIPGLN